MYLPVFLYNADFVDAVGDVLVTVLLSLALCGLQQGGSNHVIGIGCQIRRLLVP